MRSHAYRTQNTLGHRRKTLGLSQAVVAKALGLKDHTLVSRWESGTSLPSLISVGRLMNLYQVSFETLFPNLSTTIEEKSVHIPKA